MCDKKRDNKKAKYFVMCDKKRDKKRDKKYVVTSDKVLICCDVLECANML